MPTATEAPEGKPEAPEPHPPFRKPPAGSTARAGRNARELREHARITQDDLASQATWSRYDLAQFESGFGDPTLSMLRRLAAVLHTSWLDLFLK